MRLRKRKTKAVWIASCIAILASVFALYAYAVFPASFLYSRFHFAWSKHSFVRLADVFAKNPAIEELGIDPPAMVNIRVTDDGGSINFSEQDIAILTREFKKTAIYSATRGDGVIEFFAGEESKLGRNFQIRVLHKFGIRDDVLDNLIASCSDIAIFRFPQGECLDVRGDNWAIYYLWVAY